MSIIQRLKRGIQSAWYFDSNLQTKDRNLMFVGTDQDAKKELSSYDRRTMVKLSRYLSKNNGIVKGAINDMALYSVGTGIMPVARTSNEAWNDEAERKFSEWANLADLRGQHTLTELCYSWSRSIDVDGDVFVIPVRNPNGAPKLQTILGHRINKNDQANAIYDGVALDKNDRPLFYIIDEDTKIFARDIIALSDPTTADSIRGIPSTAHAINNMYDVREILALEKKGVKLNSAIATVIKTPEPKDTAGFLGRQQAQTSGSQTTTLEGILGGGIIPRLAPGEDISSFTSSRPSPTFDGFIEHFIRDFAVGIGLPFEFIWNTSMLGGTAQRFILEKAQRRFELRQAVLEKALTRIWVWYIATQIKDGWLPANDEWFKVSWQYPRKITVDAGRQGNLDIEDVKMGLSGFRDKYSSRGLDWRSELRQRALEEQYLMELSKETGVPVERISQRTPNMNEGMISKQQPQQQNL